MQFFGSVEFQPLLLLLLLRFHNRGRVSSSSLEMRNLFIEGRAQHQCAPCLVNLEIFTRTELRYIDPTFSG